MLIHRVNIHPNLIGQIGESIDVTCEVPVAFRVGILAASALLEQRQGGTDAGVDGRRHLDHLLRFDGVGLRFWSGGVDGFCRPGKQSPCSTLDGVRGYRRGVQADLVNQI